MTIDDFVNHAPSNTTGHGYGHGVCDHSDAHWGSDNSLYLSNCSGYGIGTGFCTSTGTGTGLGNGYGRGSGFGSGDCTGGNRV